MTAYDTIKLTKATGGVVTLATLMGAMTEQEAIVASTGLGLARATANMVGALKDSPFPAEETAALVEKHGLAHGEAIRHLSKLYRWFDKAAVEGAE